MLLKDVRDPLYQDVETDNGPSPLINSAADDFGIPSPQKHSDGTMTRLERDSHQRLIGRMDANGHATRFDYEGLTPPKRITFADGTRLDFRYTDAGVLESLLTGHTLLAKYNVDPDSGNWRVDCSDGTSAEFEIENGRITRAINSSGMVELKYDDDGLLISETFEGRTVTYHRNGTGHLIGLTTPLGQIIRYNRDRKNRVTSIKEWSGQNIQIAYAGNGAMESITYPNGTRLTQRSTAEGLPAELHLAATDTDETIFHKEYQRDLHSRVTRISGDKDEIIYTYDQQGQLLGAICKDPEFDEAFTVDPKANRLSDYHHHYGINEADRVMQAGDAQFQFDGLGNMIQGTCPRGHARCLYYGLNRLKTISLGGKHAQYRYDALGRRVTKKVDGVTTRYFWAGDQLIHEAQERTTNDQKSTGVTDYLFFPGSHALLALRRNQKTYWAAFGHRHEVLCLTAASGRPVWQATYDSFGKAHIEKGVLIFQPFRLAGQYKDAESGLHYYQSRYYDPDMGRYLSMTPLFLESGSENFYAYGNGDPINRIDAGGEVKFAPILLNAIRDSVIRGPVEVKQRNRTKTETDAFAIAKAALLGGVMNTLRSAMGPREEVGQDGAKAGNDAPAAPFTGLAASGLLSAAPRCPADLSKPSATAKMHRIHPEDTDKSLLSDTSPKNRIGIVKKDETVSRPTPKPRQLAMAGSPDKPTAVAAKKTIRTETSPPPPAEEIRGLHRGGNTPKCMEGDHVNVLTGEVILTHTEFTLYGRIPLIWTCHYQSGNAYSGLLGRGWQTPADARLEVDDKGFVRFLDGGPTGVMFDQLPTDRPVMASVNSALLTATQEHYQVRLKSGLTYHFPKKISQSLSHVERIADVHDNFISFYRENTILTQIRNSSDQRLHIRCKEGRIISINRREKPLVAYHYEGEHLTAAVDSLGHQKSYYYCNGMMVRHMDKNKHSFYFKYANAGKCIRIWDDSGLYEYQFDYQPRERRIEVTNSIGHKKTYTFDPARQTLIEDNHTGATITRDYDEMGRMIASTDGLNQSTAYLYDRAGNLTDIVRDDTRLMSMTYDNNNRPVRSIDAKGIRREQHFDDHGQLTEKINPLEERIRYTYNHSGDLTSIIEEGLTTAFEYDDHGQVCTMIRGKNSPTQYQRDLSGNVTAVIDPAGQATRYVYDNKFRLIQAIQPSGIGQSFDWDPEDNLLIYTDPNGRQTCFEYGVGNKIVRRINADNTSVSFQYDTEDHLISIINERKQIYHRNYGQTGRVTTQTDYFGNTSRFGYDATGQLIERIDPRGNVINYTYDPLGRLITQTFENEEQASFNWDANGNLISCQSPDVQVERIYDTANRMTAEKKGGFAVEYQYDRSGRPTQRSTSHGNRVRYSYDPTGAVTAIQINELPPVTIKRNDRNQITDENFFGFLNRSYSYDQDGLMTCQTINGNVGEIDRRYSYDGAANLIAKQDSHKGDWRFTYDAMDRITEALDPKQQTHRLAYDPCGDLVCHLPDVKEGLRCAQYNNTRYQYDAAGNLVQRENDDAQYRFEWDEQNHLAAIHKDEAQTAAMVYDGLGRRHSKTINNERTLFNWDGHTLISEQLDGGPVKEYVYYPGTLLPLAVIADDGRVYFYHNDINGLPQELTKPNGEIVWSASYDALGRVEQIQVDDVPQPLRFPGQYYDKEIDLCYHGRRYFDPMTCAYISPNRLEPTDGENPYTYAPNVWTPADTVGFCKTLLKKTALRKRHGDIKDACMLPVPGPPSEFQNIGLPVDLL